MLRLHSSIWRGHIWAWLLLMSQREARDVVPDVITALPVLRLKIAPICLADGDSALNKSWLMGG